MARANRLRVDGGVFHVTHRCHNREILLKFARDQMKLGVCWPESLAVGSAGFVEKFKPPDGSRKETEIVDAGSGAWALQEAATPYGLKMRPKNAAKTSRSGDSGFIRL